MGIISISDLEDATGQTITDVPRAQFMINAVSSFVESYTGQVFGRTVTETVTRQADSYGLIIFNDIDAVNTIINVRTNTVPVSWAFDGMFTIYGLCPSEVVQVNYTYGWENTPVDIASIVTALVSDGLGLTLLAPGELQKKRVGDIEYTYSVQTGANGDLKISVSSLMESALESYRFQASNRTIRTGPMYFPPTFPLNWL
jgi:hypothetical protein